MNRPRPFLIGVLGALAGAAALFAGFQWSSQDLIYQGNPSDGRFPHVVRLAVGGTCTGVLIGRRTVLSAGKQAGDGKLHCMPEPGYTFTVESDDWGPGRTATTRARHEQLDLGVACLDKDHASPKTGALPSAGVVPGTTTVVAVGYGQTRLQKLKLDLTGPRLPTWGETSIVSNQTTATHFVVAGGKPPCEGDSGGPGFVGTTDVIAGIAERYLSASSCGASVRYTRIDTPEVLEWIHTVRSKCE